MGQEGRPAWRPNPEQELLLTAVVGPVSRAIVAFRDWWEGIEDAEFESLDPGSQWLLPLLYSRRRILELPSPLLGISRNVYRHNWYRNHLLWHRVSHEARVRTRPSAPTVLLKGIAMSLAFYRNLGVRPFSGVDLLIRHPESSASIDSTSWQILHDSILTPELDRTALGRTVPVTAAGAESFEVLESTDQLLHILHSQDWDPRSDLFWVVDGVTVLTDSPGLDWAEFHRSRLKLESAEVVQERLDYLLGRIGVGDWTSSS